MWCCPAECDLESHSQVWHIVDADLIYLLFFPLLLSVFLFLPGRALPLVDLVALPELSPFWFEWPWPLKEDSPWGANIAWFFWSPHILSQSWCFHCMFLFIPLSPHLLKPTCEHETGGNQMECPTSKRLGSSRSRSRTRNQLVKRRWCWTRCSVCPFISAPPFLLTPWRLLSSNLSGHPYACHHWWLQLLRADPSSTSDSQTPKPVAFISIPLQLPYESSSNSATFQNGCSTHPAPQLNSVLPLVLLDSLL